jgi:hydroxymethylpyrimidine pyrophosphatase-like HAD family hydrolase
MKDIFRERVGIRHPSIIRHPLLKMMTILILIPYFLGCLVPVKAFVLDPSAATSIRSIQKSPLHAADASAGGASHLEKLKILFSDVDGALIHYPENNIYDDSSGQILELPPSATGMKGIISAKTLATCRDLRQKGLKLVLISGMRTSTLLGRLPYLPRADAYCTEAGGRIFYPIKVASFEGEEEMDSEFEQQQWTPLEFSGALPEDLQPFGLREDMTWRKRMESEQAAGKDGYAGNEVFSNRLCEEDDEDDEECLIDYENPYGFPKQQDVIPIQQRKGLLWEFARQLQDDYDFVLDTKSYSSCFRVNRKHQTGGTDDGVGKFQALLKGDIAHPLQLGKSTNLGCIDIYPVSSGKRNW